MANGENGVLSRKVRGPKMRISGFPAMEPLCNAFASICATMSRKDLRPGIDVSVFGFEVFRHSDYLRQLNAPSAIYLISFPQSRGTGLVKAHPQLLSKILDISLGGDGSFEGGQVDRPLTQIDVAIYGRFVDLVCRAFDEAIRELCGHSPLGPPRRSKFEEQPGMIRIAPDRAEIFAIKLNFHIGDEKPNAGLDFVVPVSTLEPLKGDLKNIVPTSEAGSAAWESYMRGRVLDLPLDLRGVIEVGSFSVGELSRLRQGQVIELAATAIDEVELRIETTDGPVAFARGRLGSKGRHKAVRLTDDPDADFIRPMLETK